MKHLRILPLALFFVMSCATTPNPPDSQLPGDAEFKRAFLAYYPELTPEQRDQLMSAPDAWKASLAEWGILKRFYSQPNPNEPVEFSGSSDNYTFRDLRIVVADSAPEPALKAVAVFRDGREFDVTRDVRWIVFPKLGHIEITEGGVPRLVSGCMASHLEVSADFYGERQGTLLLPIKKNIERLEIRGMESTENAVKLVAWCRDGETTDVSCQADWDIQSPDYEIHGCGQLRRKHVAPDDTEPKNAVIRAAYGSLDTSKTFRLR